MVEDKIIWQGVKQRMTSTMSNEDFKIMCKLHSKYLIISIVSLCTCNKRRLRQWIEELNDKLI